MKWQKIKNAGLTSDALAKVYPIHALDWKTDENGRVVLQVPKFRNRFAVRYLLPYLKHPWIHVHLDDLGSLVWKMCDGKTSVREMARQLQERFGDAAKPALERTTRFIQILEQQKYIRLCQ